MQAVNKKAGKNAQKELYLSVLVVILLFLSALNIFTYFKPRKVLGAKTQIDSNEFWKDFMTKNPEYLPGWIELGEFDKVAKIDPNYQIENTN